MVGSAYLKAKITGLQEDLSKERKDLEDSKKNLQYSEQKIKGLETLIAELERVFRATYPKQKLSWVRPTYPNLVEELPRDGSQCRFKSCRGH